MEVNMLTGSNTYEYTPREVSTPVETAPPVQEVSAPPETNSQNGDQQEASQTQEYNRNDFIDRSKIQDKEQHKALENLDKAIVDANKKMFGSSRELQYSVHKKTKQIMVKIRDSETKQIIRELPPEKTLDAIAKVWEMVGILVDKKL